MPDNPLHRISFTWNYTSKLGMHKRDFCRHHKYIKRHLRKTYKTAAFVFQLELGKKARRPHYQGHIKWKDSIKVKEYYPEKIIGTTNLSADISSKVNCDFVIVGSLEEKCSLSKYQNVFL